jgi:hypothetical protein
MISGTDLEATAEKTLRRAVVSLPPKRRSKFVCETPSHEEALPAVGGFARRPRMKRSGPMSLHWRGVPNEESKNAIRVSPEILSAFNRAIGALGQSPAKPAHATA